MTAPAITTTSARQPAVPSHFDVAAAVKDAGIAALLTLGLSIPILSYRTDQSGALLFLTPRWGLVALVCSLVFALRIAIHAFLATRAARQAVASPRQATDIVDGGPSAFQKAFGRREPTVVWRSGCTFTPSAVARRLRVVRWRSR